MNHVQINEDSKLNKDKNNTEEPNKKRIKILIIEGKDSL